MPSSLDASQNALVELTRCETENEQLRAQLTAMQDMLHAAETLRQVHLRTLPAHLAMELHELRAKQESNDFWLEKFNAACAQRDALQAKLAEFPADEVTTAEWIRQNTEAVELAEHFRDQRDALQAKWDSMPWEELWRMYNGAANDATWEAIGNWLLDANAEQETGDE